MNQKIYTSDIALPTGVSFISIMPVLSGIRFEISRNVRFYNYV